MKPKTFGKAMLSIILVIILVPLMMIAFNKEQEAAAVVCEFCDGACTVSHKAACKTAHNAPNYYYYTYKCKDCGNEFTVEICQKNFSKTP